MSEKEKKKRESRTPEFALLILDCLLFDYFIPEKECIFCLIKQNVTLTLKKNEIGTRNESGEERSGLAEPRGLDREDAPF